MRGAARGLARRALRTPLARRAVAAALRDDPAPAVELLVSRSTHGAGFARVDVPERVEGFEDLTFLFSRGQLNHGIALLTLDEAAFLWRAASGARTIAEIGRFRGGSTVVLASAMPADAELWSYDLHVKLPGEVSGADLDRELAAALDRLGLGGRVHLVVGDAATAEPPPRPCDLVFVDGDHTYAGVRRDYEAWAPRVGPGGTIAFHDAGGATPHEEVMRLVAEVDRETFEPAGEAGSIVAFRRRP